MNLIDTLNKYLLNNTVTKIEVGSNNSELYITLPTGVLMTLTPKHEDSMQLDVLEVQVDEKPEVFYSVNNKVWSIEEKIEYWNRLNEIPAID